MLIHIFEHAMKANQEVRRDCMRFSDSGPLFFVRIFPKHGVVVCHFHDANHPWCVAVDLIGQSPGQ